MSQLTEIETIEQANEDAHIKTLQFANIAEFNAFMESFSFTEYPINIVVPFENRGQWIDGRRKGVIPMQGWVLTRISDDTVNVRSIKAEKEYISPMRAKAKQFLFSLINSDITDPEVANITDNIKPEFAFLSMRAFGVSYTMNWPVVETVPCTEDE